MVNEAGFSTWVPATEPNKVFLLCAIFVLSMVYLWKNRIGNFPPGPWGFPIVGNLMVYKQRPHVKITHLSKRYGNIFSLNLGKQRTVVISSFEGISEGLIKHSEEFAGRPSLFSTPVLFDGKRDGGKFKEFLSSSFDFNCLLC